MNAGSAMSNYKNEELKHKMGKLSAIPHVLTIILMAIALTVSSSSYAQVKLKKSLPELCYECHQGLKKDLADQYTHFLFKQGKCTKCHNAHVSNVKGLMNDRLNAVCIQCHGKLIDPAKKPVVHIAIRDGACSDCHNSHSGSNEHLLVTDEKTLCMNCHEGIKEQLEKPHTCDAFKEGKCSSCHDAHASAENNLLISKPNKLCQKCHAPGCKAGKVSLSTVVKDLDCTTCHTGHSAGAEGLLGPFGHSAFLLKKCEECHLPFESGQKISTKIEGDKLCFSCHSETESGYKFINDDVHVKDVKNSCDICHDHHASGKKNLTKDESGICITCHEKTEKRTVSMEKVLRSIKCEPVKNRKCFDCHIPSHSDLPLNYRGDGIEMCARCHESQHKITHPLGKDVLDPRNGQPLTCISCHSMHSAKAKFMLTFEKNRALCIQCHKM